MTKQPIESDSEFAAMRVIYEALEPLDDNARGRVVSYVVDRFGIAGPKPRSKAGTREVDDATSVTSTEGKPTDYASLPDLYDAARPQTNPDKALIAGYWLQECVGAESFDGQSANRELKHLGQGVSNITVAINGLKSQKPALALQLKKSGSSRQARKTYKITVAGINAVRAMINGQDASS